MLIVFKLPELSLSCSKRIIDVFHLSQLMMEIIFQRRVFRFYLKSVQESSIYKETCFERKIKSEVNMNSGHLFKLATFEMLYIQIRE